MSADPVRSLDPSVRALIRGLADAADAQLVRTVALLDAMPNRGAADALLDPVRKRLAGLHPRRPLNFCRLLFSPLDPVIVPAARWHPASPTIPRTALLPLAETVHAMMGEAVRPIEAIIKGRTAQDQDIVGKAGRMLWPQAGRILSREPAPIGWGHTSLNPAVYPPLARRVGAVLLQLAGLDALAADVALGLAAPNAEKVIGILQGIAAQEADAQPMMITLLLARVPQVSRILAGAAAALDQEAATRLRQAGEQAIDLLLDQLEMPGLVETQLLRDDLLGSAEAVRRVTHLLKEAETTALSQRQRSRLATIRRRLDGSCRTRFSAGLAIELITRLKALAGAQDAGSIGQLEIAARGLRALESEARNLGSGPSYDALLRHAADTVRSLPAGPSLGQVERMRLVEILAGPDAALAMRER